MNRTAIGLVVLALSTASLVGCGEEDPPTTSTPSGSASGTPTGSGGTSSNSDKATPSNIGPKCKSYIACCEQIVKSQPSMASACNSTSDAIDKAIDSGASTSTYETTCGQALDMAKQAGYCK
jgi:hypothetical protein